jgi:hypothetical protein
VHTIYEVFVVLKALLVDIQLEGFTPERAEIHDDEGTGDVLGVTADRVTITVTSTARAVSMGACQRDAV